MNRENVLASAAGGTVVVCEAKVAEDLRELKPRIVEEPTAGDALPLALERMEAKSFDDAATLDANYLRRTDAEIFAKPAVKAEIKAER
jgi:tRNA threonylcarbamoyladenosine biosynthesis protein TsaB